MSHFEKVKVDPLWSDQSGPRGERGLAGRDGASIIGPSGADGVDGLGFNYLGAWSKRTYKINDVVHTGGSSYVCLRNHSNRRPPSKKFWGLLAQGGERGEKGDPAIAQRGRRGLPGADATATSTIELICDSDVLAGQAVYATATGCDLAFADDDRHLVIGLAKTNATAGSPVEIVTDGTVSADWTPIVGGALFVGGQYFLSDTTPGMLTKTAPSTSGSYIVRVAQAVSLSTTIVEVSQPIAL